MQLKIWHKMIIGITIPSLIALLGGLMTFGYINDVKNRHGFVEIADDIREHVLEIRRNEKNFLHYKNEEHLKNFKDEISIFINSINNIPPETIEELGKEDFSLLRKSIEPYPDPIDALYKNYQQEAETIKKVRIEGRKLEAFVEKGKHAEDLSVKFILNLRRLEKNYMLFHDRKSFLELVGGLSQLKNFTPLCYECAPYIETIRNLSVTYEKIDQIIDDLQVTGDKLEEIATRIARNERLHIKTFFTMTQMFLLVTLILLCTLGPLFVYKTSDYIVAPIKRLAEIIKKISEGDTTLRAKFSGHDEIYSLALSFNTMLDNLQQTQESLKNTVQLLHEKQKESEKSASLGFLISGVTHELNNPLNNISLTAETMKEDLKDLEQEELEEFIQDIITQSERAKHIIEDLLDYSGSHKSKVMEKIDIVSAVEESVNLIANELRVTNIKLIVDVPNKAFFITGNRVKLEEVFVNIMVNAIHAMKDTKNKGTLTVNTEPDTENNNIFIKINDTGPGIPEEHIGNIFEPFFTTKDVGEGTGLGLSVSQGIINDHKGEIVVESKAGTGCTFIIKLPLYEDKAA
jgi:signal transduction histidine kinase